ncbi:MAG: potassium channel family protein [Chloroflexi bacterium]|nr:potassium channel family protein [Chloroflexota bacterium]
MERDALDSTTNARQACLADVAETLDVVRRREISERVERAIRVPMLVLAIVFLLAVALPELALLPAEVELALEAVNWLIWAVFAFELAVMTYLAPDRRRYLLVHWVDVLTVAVPALRPLRVLRILILSLRIWAEAKDAIRQRTMSVIAITSVLCIWAAATLVFFAERGGDGPIASYEDALWWAVVTITTVGYGDVYPKTAAGRGIAFALMLVGISIFGLLTAKIAAIFVEAEGQDKAAEAADTQRQLEEILVRLARIERHLARERAPDLSAPAPTQTPSLVQAPADKGD